MSFNEGRIFAGNACTRSLPSIHSLPDRYSERSFFILTKSMFSPGLDTDAWNMLLAARFIAHHHSYVASRLPGYPVPESFFALLAGFPVWVALCSTIAVSVLGFVAFRKILRGLGSPEAGITALAYICTPIVLVNCITTMDYLWAISFALLSFLSAQRRRVVLAGLLFGISVGCRITSVLMAAPIAWLVYSSWPESIRRRKYVAVFLATGLAAGAACFIPVISVYGTGFLRHAPRAPLSWVLLLKTVTVDSFGIVGTFAIIGGILYHILKRKDPSPVTKSIDENWKVISWAVVGLYGALFVYLPLEAGYLIPAIPFGLLLLSHYLSRPAFRIVACGLVLSPFLLGLDAKDRPWSAPPSPVSARVIVSGRTLSLDVLYGPIASDLMRRRAQRAYADSILAWSAAHESDKTTIVSGSWFPILAYLAGREIDNTREDAFEIGQVRLTGLLGKEAALRAVNSGSSVCFLPGQDMYNRDVYGFELAAMGAKPIQLR